MKPILLIAFIIGVFLPLTWRKVTAPSNNVEMTEGISTQSSKPGRYSRSHRTRGPALSPIELTENAIERYSQSDDPKSWERRQLQRLMFTLELEDIAQALSILAEVENPERFGEITRALYARWAELDPLAACEAAVITEDQGAEPLRGAMVTWLAADEAAALKWIGETKPPHAGLLKEWLKNYDAKKHADAAKAVDLLFNQWPEGADPLRLTLAERWVMDDWESASEWIQEDEDTRRRDANLARIARLRGEFHGLDALKITNLMSTDSGEAQARRSIFYWWAFESPELVIQNLTGSGIPLDWTDKELQTLGNGSVGQHPEYLGEVLKLCRTTQQMESVCLGMLGNNVLKQPEALTLAALNLPDSSVNNAKGKSTLTRYYGQLASKNPEAAERLYRELSPTKQAVIEHLQPASYNSPQQPNNQ